MKTTVYRKKHLSVPLKFLLALLLLISCLLTSCGNGDADTVTTDTDPTDIKGEEITADQWKAAFDLSSLTNFSMKTSFVEQENNCLLTVRYTETGMQWIGDLEGVYVLNAYFDIAEDGTYTGYIQRFSESKDSMYWDWETSGESREELFAHLNIDDYWWGRMFVMWDRLTFDMVTYDQAQKGYVLSVDSDDIQSFLCKIVNGFVAYYEIESAEYSKYPEKTIIYDIGTTTVEKPADLPQ